MSGVLVPIGPGEAEITEKRSRFLARVRPCYTEADALDMLREIRKLHSDASHNVYAYKIRENGAMRYSDDGEPSGTSGMPVLDVFRKAGLGDFCCVVTRWFGGTLLGTGGLVRAYSEAAKAALDAAGVGELVTYRVFQLPCPYALADRLRYAVESAAIVDSTDYGELVTFTVLSENSKTEALARLVAEVTSGSVTLTEAGERKTAIPSRPSFDDLFGV